MESTSKVVSGIMTETDIASVGSSFTTASGNMISSFTGLLPTILIIAVAGFGIYTVYKLVKKVRKGGK